MPRWSPVIIDQEGEGGSPQKHNQVGVLIFVMVLWHHSNDSGCMCVDLYLIVFFGNVFDMFPVFPLSHRTWVITMHAAHACRRTGSRTGRARLSTTSYPRSSHVATPQMLTWQMWPQVATACSSRIAACMRRAPSHKTKMQQKQFRRSAAAAPLYNYVTNSSEYSGVAHRWVSLGVYHIFGQQAQALHVGACSYAHARSADKHCKTNTARRALQNCRGGLLPLSCSFLVPFLCRSIDFEWCNSYFCRPTCISDTLPVLPAIS